MFHVSQHFLVDVLYICRNNHILSFIFITILHILCIFFFSNYTVFVFTVFFMFDRDTNTFAVKARCVTQWTYNELSLFGNNSKRKCVLATLLAFVMRGWIIFPKRVCRPRPSRRQCVLTKKKKKKNLRRSRRKRVKVYCRGSQPGCRGTLGCREHKFRTP